MSQSSIIGKLGIGLLLWTCGTAHAEPLCTTQAQAFWSRFRAAVIDYDVEAIVTMTKFPLPVVGELDFIPVHQVRKKQFRQFWPLLLAYNYEPPSATSMFEVVEKTAQLDNRMCHKDGSFRVDAWDFYRIQGHFKLARAGLNSSIERPR